MELVVVDSEGSESRVVVERSGDHFSVELGGVVYEVDRVRAGSSQRSLLIDGGQWELFVRAAGRGHYLLSQGSSEVSLEVRNPLDHLSRMATAAAPAGSRSVAAYMPGRVVTLLVAEGDVVEAGAGVVVLEAMKMENEIQAEAAGVVARIFVEEGQSVEGGDPLFEIDPA